MNDKKKPATASTWQARQHARLYRRRKFFWAAAIKGKFWPSAASIPVLIWALTHSPHIVITTAKALAILWAAIQIWDTLHFDLPMLRMRYEAWELDKKIRRRRNSPPKP